MPHNISVDLLKWRNKYALEQKDAADYLRVNVRTLQGWEGGREVHNLVAPWIKAALKWSPTQLNTFHGV